jgi:membrane-bound lytic murein transglycosylase D
LKVKVSIFCVFGVLWQLSFPAISQTTDSNLDAAIRSAQEWAEQNLDEDALRVLRSVDQQRVRDVFAQIEKQFQGDYVLDLAELNQTAKSLVPLLENYEETLPYALWLKTRLDYLEAADQLRPKTSPKPEPGQPPNHLPNPLAQTERELWIKKLAKRPWPKAAETYVPQLKSVFTEERIPAELVWIAEVESSFDPRARSLQGAAGLFQLMPATAKRYGLRTFPFDQRLNPEPSARAAAKYLRYLHGHFKDWRLALAAYNSGEGTVDTLLKKQKTKTFDAISTHLPAETQMYVPKMEATLFRREGMKLADLKLPAA